jgi:energy-coupling factor transport system ATP-binding protein
LEIRAENLDYVYNPGTPLELKALDRVTFTLPHSKVLGILGGTGSGKTTLVKNLNGLLIPTKGRMLLDGKDSQSYGALLRRKVGVVFQRPERQLFEQTVYRDISFALTRLPGMEEEEIRERVEDACKLVGLDLTDVANRSPFALSAGQKRKVAIAGILVNRPETLVLDEPTVGLDPPSSRELVLLLKGLKKSGNRTIVIVSHNLGPFLPLLDCLLALDRGRVAGFGSPAEVCEKLADDAVMRQLLPELALVVHDLRKAGCPIPRDEYRIPELLDRLTHLSPSIVGRR